MSRGPCAGEQLWRMPIEPSYRRHLDSMIADLKNWSAKPGGGITAALFLQEFVSTDKVPPMSQSEVVCVLHMGLEFGRLL